MRASSLNLGSVNRFRWWGLAVVLGTEVVDAALNLVLDVLRGRSDGLTNVMGFVFAVVLVDSARFVGAGAGVGSRFGGGRFDRSPSLLGVTLDLLGCAFVGEVVVVGCFADRLLYLAGDLIELALQSVFGSSAHSPVSFLRADAEKACLMMVRWCWCLQVWPRLADAAELKPASAGDEVVDQDDYGNHQQDVNEASADVQGEAKKPED
jgi:hypothetical protein